MNKTLLLIICDFLLLNLLALTSWEKAEPTAVTHPAPGKTADAGASSKDQDLVETMRLSLEDERSTRTQLSSDGGSDGIIDQDVLGLSSVYVQAKRYSKGNNVQRPEIQAFIGALNGIDKGVFVTTSKFSPGAVECAERCVHAKVVLIDGERLVQMMMDHDLGVYTRKNMSLISWISS